MANEYDVVVLGGGTGGYVAAIAAAKKGQRVAVVEKDKLGGTCLHRGCIPTKALLRSAEVLETVKQAAAFGVTLGSDSGLETSTINFVNAQARKQKIVDQLEAGVKGLMKKGKIDVFYGTGTILGPSIFSPTAGTISITYSDDQEPEMIIPKSLIIATGSQPQSLPGLNFDEETVLSSDGMLQLEALPESLVIVGGGVIGMEWASMLHDFGVKVTVLEYADRIIPTEDAELSRTLQRIKTKKGITIVTKAKVLADTFTKTEDGITIQAEVKGETITYSAEKIMVSVGRKANTTSIGLQNTAIKTDRDFIEVNDHYQTAESHMYAIGDCIPTMQLAHVAMHEGQAAVDHIVYGDSEKMNYDQVPRCVYTTPEIASVGISEAQAKERGHEVKVGKFNFQGNGKALVFGEAEGFIKVVADKETNDLLGVSIIGPHATDLISEAGLAQVLDATPWEIGTTIHPHPTLSEALAEAALAVDGNAVHG